MAHAVTIIIPTLALAERSTCLDHAIESVTSQKGIKPVLLIVVNGDRADPAVVHRLRRETRVQVLRVDEANYAAATHVGRCMVQTDSFAFLDDDDWLLADTLATRVDQLFAHRVDVLVTNGFRPNQDLLYADPDSVNRDPIDALLRGNWLASCAGVFRTETIGQEFFDRTAKHVEWTLLAFKLAASGKRIRFMNVPAYKIEDTPGSASKAHNLDYFHHAIRVSSYIHDHAEARHRALARKALVGEVHHASDYCRENEMLPLAWQYHFRSIRLGGWRHLLYTRHLIASSLSGRRMSHAVERSPLKRTASQLRAAGSELSSSCDIESRNRNFNPSMSDAFR